MTVSTIRVTALLRVKDASTLACQGCEHSNLTMSVNDSSAMCKTVAESEPCWLLHHPLHGYCIINMQRMPRILRPLALFACLP